MFKKILKKAAAVVMALAMVAIIVPASKAEAYEAGTYKVTANMYVPKKYNPVMSIWNAYFTTEAMPPNSGSTMNATMTVEADGSATIHVPFVNSGLSLLKFPLTEHAEKITVAGTERYTCGTGKHSFTRFTGINVALNVNDVSGTVSYTFGQSVIHAQVKLGFLPVHDSDETVAGLQLDIDLDSAKQVG